MTPSSAHWWPIRPQQKAFNLTLFSCSFVLCACPKAPFPSDSGVLVIDGGGLAVVGDRDAGSQRDGGNSLDAGNPSDAGTTLRDNALAQLRRSLIPLRDGWRFEVDPSRTGVSGGWQSSSFNDGSWARIEAGRPWEEQGFAGYDGVGWYRTSVVIPADWAGSTVHVIASGVDDEYDLFVNGQLARHHGQNPERSVWGAQTLSRIDSLLTFGGPNLIAFRVTDWGANGGLWREVKIKQSVPLEPYRSLLPEPLISTHPEWTRTYWAAWQMAFDKIQFGTPQNGFVDAYMDEGFNEQIFQWDSSFIALFGRYGRRLFPAIETLDNFYRKQRPDGYIQRVYSETNGREVGMPNADEPMVNPPLFAWVEWEYYRLSGDHSRLATVYPKLVAYFGWLKANVRSPDGAGLYYQTDLGSGMDNTPRPNAARGAWVDESAQQALAAWALARIAGAIGKPAEAASWDAEQASIAALINRYLWHINDAFYYDRTPAGTLTGVKHLGAMWAMIGGVADANQVDRLHAHLINPAEFYRPHLFPTLAASDPSYDPTGHYWLGSVWAPTTYMTVKGLRKMGRHELALEAAVNHVTQVATVFHNPPMSDSRIVPEERNGSYATIWECYSAEQATPATRWDGVYYSRQNFVGWSGLGPIALLIEEVLGFEVEAASNRITWRLNRVDEHGIDRLALGADNLVGLVASPRATAASGTTLTTRATRSFHLTVTRAGVSDFVTEVPAGSSTLIVP